MKAMILAAGLGTRLKPLTDNKPKALVEVDGIPMLERVILSLKNQGFDYIVVNVHHFSSMIKEFLASHDFGLEVAISDESNSLLDTGGGIVNAYDLLFQHDDKPFLVHNVDILSNAFYRDLFDSSRKKEGAVLLTSNRDSSRKLLFDDEYTLKGWHDLSKNIFRPANINSSAGYKELAFSGIYLLEKRNVEEMSSIIGEKSFPVMDYFLHPSRKNPVFGLEKSDLKLLDIGKPATLSQASSMIKSFNKLSID